MRRLSVYDQDADDSLRPIEQEQVREAVTFPERTTSVTKPYRTNLLAKALIIVNAIISPLYLSYILRHGRSDMPVFLAIFFLGEAATLLLNLGNRLVLWHRQRRHVCRLDALTPAFPRSQWPKVHIFFTHYQEPIDESVKPLKRALRQQYPPELLVVTILDDGYHKRKGEDYETTDMGRAMEEMVIKTLARMAQHGQGTVSRAVRIVLPGDREHGRPEVAPGGSTVIEFRAEGLPLVRLVGRMKGRESHLKTGNLENALWNIMEEDVHFMVVLDTDMAPERDMLQLLLPPMLEYRAASWGPDWRTGFVVSPQACTNVEAVFGTDDPMNQANKYNWRIAPAALDAMGFVHFWGTNTAFFVPALKQANGFMYGCIGEDTVTGAAIHRLGWTSTFVGAAGVTLARGLCRTSVAETFDQRKRWVQGNVQQFLKEFDPPLLLHEGFRNPPYYREYLEKVQEVKALDQRGNLVPIAPDDCGAQARRARRTPWWAFRCEIAYFGPKYTAIFNLMPLHYYGLAMAILLTGQVPFMMHVGPFASPWEVMDSFYVMVMYWVTTALVSVFLHSNIVGDANNPSNTLWRTQQEFWGYAWARIIGMIEGLLSALTGKQPKWNAFGMAGGINLLLEVPNALAVLAMAGAMIAVSVNYCVEVFGGIGSGLSFLPGVSTIPVIQLAASMVVSFWVLFLLWPVTSCIYADFLGIPYYRIGATLNTLIAGVAQVGFAAFWTLTAVHAE